MERMWRIHQILSGGTFPNCTGLSGELEVSAKTVMRDLEFMRDRLGLPLEYDAVKHGYYYTAPVRDFPTMKVTQGEVAALIVQTVLHAGWQIAHRGSQGGKGGGHRQRRVFPGPCEAQTRHVVINPAKDMGAGFKNPSELRGDDMGGAMGGNSSLGSFGAEVLKDENGGQQRQHRQHGQTRCTDRSLGGIG